MTDRSDGPPPHEDAESGALEPVTPTTGAIETGTAREQARRQADELRTLRKKTDRRRRLLLRGGIAFGIIAVIAIVTLVLVTVTRPSGRGPQNMLSDGIVIGRDQQAIRTEALRAGEDPVPTRSRDGVVAIRMYVDFFQRDSAAFMKANRAQLRQYLDSGAATLEIHPIAIASTGTDGAQYSLRAANALGCVAQFAPDRAFAFTVRLLDRQPDPKSSGLDDGQIATVARASGVTQLDEVRRCINTERFNRWAQSATQRASAGPLPGTKVRRVAATPTVLLDGAEYRGEPGDAGAFGRAFVAAVGGSFTEDASPSPTPSPTPSATP